MTTYLLTILAAAAAASTKIQVDTQAKPEQTLTKFWQASVGSGHAALGLRADWQAQLKAVHDDCGIQGVRFHGSFDDDMGPVVDAHGVYNWTLLDKLYDGIMAAGVKPIVELSFMPSAIANCTMPHCHTDMHYKGLITHPKSWEMWYDLVHAFVQHLVDRHGIAEVLQWRFEVWNEMWGMAFGDGSKENSPYMNLYNASHAAIKRVSPKLSVGGPATEEVENVADFVTALDTWKICDITPQSGYGCENDFVSTHSYPTDVCNSNHDARSALDCFTDAIIEGRNQAKNHTFLMTEFNCGWKNSAIHDGESHAYAASFMFRTVNALRMHDISALSWWTFSSIFEEGNLPTNEFGPFGANSAMQTVHGIPLPIYRGFQLLADAGDVVLPVMSGESGGESSGVGGVGGVGGGSPFNQSSPLTTFATKNTTTNTMHIFLSNFAPDDGKGANSGGGGSSGAAASNAMDGEETNNNNIDAGRTSAAAHAIQCSKSKASSCTDSSCFLPNTDFPGGDLLPESQKFKTDNATDCCAACLAFKPDKFCQAWSWKSVDDKDPNRCYLKGFEMGAKTKVHGITAGYPTGIAPAPPSNGSWYTQSRTVQLTLTGAKHVGVEGALAGQQPAQQQPRSTAGGAGPTELAAFRSTTATLRMINSTCANPKALWVGELKSITWPSPSQLQQLQAASKMCEETIPVTWSDTGVATVEVVLEAYAAAELILPLP